MHKSLPKGTTFHEFMAAMRSWQGIRTLVRLSESVLFEQKMSKRCSDFYFSLEFPLFDPKMQCRKLLNCLFICADVVYIGVIHPYHLSTSLLFTNAKKNVLCEKPLAMNSKEVRQILESAKKNDVFFMEVGMVAPKTLHYNSEGSKLEIACN